MNSKMTKRWLSVLVCCAVLIVSAPITSYADSTLDHLNDQYEQLENQQQAIKDKLSATKTEKEKQEAIRSSLTSQITTTQQQITLLDNKINYLQNDIAEKEQKIEELSAEVLEQQDLFMKRIRSIYKSSVGTSMLGMVFGVDSLGSYLSYGKYLSRISEHDSTLLQTLADNIAELRELQQQMQVEKEDLADTKVTAESKKASLTSQKTEVESTLQDIKKMEQEYLADQAAIQKEMQQIQADIDAIYAAAAGSGSQVDYSTTGFIYPIKGYTYISSYYGWRFNNTDYHTGVDFPAPANTPIRASASGTVIYVRTGAGYGRNWGYGNYLIVDHGGGFSTLYAHCTSIPVSVGDTVTKGQTIAYVGTTGWSTGYHLHFEIRRNGAHTNPLNYL
ncbi:MAG: peptidoglycan DD-metalloendopeptidase family protein [Angelakisella sp.]|nr:peptidoglycan DD-metalloendopeptidase family protein [Angelakisella sp.]MBS7324891.1 peptidoglycan DD-metalloendopeptidase family protein [Angelakisella sp.]